MAGGPGMLDRVILNRAKVYEWQVGLDGLDVLWRGGEHLLLEFSKELEPAGAQNMDLRSVNYHIKTAIQLEHIVFDYFQRVGNKSDQTALQHSFELGRSPKGGQTPRLSISHPREVAENL